MLPFLRNIRRIQIGFFDDDGKEASSVTYDLTQLEPSHVLLKKIKTEKAASEEFVQHFTIISHTAEGLAKNENRTYTKSEGASQAYSKSEVILAFPISEKPVPIIEPQQVYAFLPVRPVGFNFLIQADFVTEASRQDIVKDSLCNLGLLKAIAEAFASAATELSEHEALRYTWPAYLPNTTGSWEMFWLSLVDEIRTSLQKAPAFYDYKGYGWRLLRDLLHATSDMFDENQKLLLEDGDPAEVISRQYGSTDLKILKSYGLCDVTPARFIRWLGADLANGITSRMQSQGTTDLWHEQTAAISNFALNHRTVRGFHGPKIKDMDLVPLEGGSWTSASLGPIYLPTVKGLDIPVDLGMRILSRRVEGEKRSLLVNSLGVKPFLNAPGIIGSIWPSLFQDTVGIGDCTSEILVDELKQLKASECCDIERIGNIYHALHKLLQSNTGSEQSNLKAIFENEALIYVPSDDASSWYKVSQCVWSSAAKLRGRVSLTDDYKDLEEFFVGHLGVRPVDLAMAIDELRQVAVRDSTTVNEIKDFIWIINSLLPSGNTSPVPQDILRARIFPVRYPNGRVQVRAYDTAFFIIDRESLGSSFESKVKLFDFKLEQVARLRPYIEWLNIQGL
ncbi:hypothetical protein BDP55DRAFT_727812 [Colletotrichum godetiae]|uniref:Uncharacterized protein n=1 Tax=Colletotrichum godetiae TaxID=1209918 RepID=A0AAJ0AM81_9PEZI|nr:uncharacterized protein BDP55DRAFT_727812 [Colletotrichum godetiae]KAK1676481.1 hypothetical protein BDP55DRAFT_727812 [Colletotrichum godetiae]